MVSLSTKGATMYLNRRFVSWLAAAVCAAVVPFSGCDVANGAEFVNLDFELAVIGIPMNHFLPASEAMPGWTTGNSAPGYVAYDAVTLGSTMVSIQDGLTPYGRPAFMQPIQGSYTALLQSGLYPDHGGFHDAWISQTGDIPVDARSLKFSSDFISGGNLVVSLNGTVLLIEHQPKYVGLTIRVPGSTFCRNSSASSA
jgi:hypothetical protein